MQIILPANVVGTDLKSFTVLHPKTGSEELLFASRDKVYELTKYNQEFGSWFVGNTVSQDASLYFLTDVDITFWALPSLRENIKWFRSIHDIFNEKSGLAEVSLVLQENDACLANVADFKTVDDEKYFKCNETKVLNWLASKVENIIDALKEKEINVSKACATVAGFVFDSKPEQTKDELLVYAFELIDQYLPDDLSMCLRKHLNVPEDVEQSPVKTSGIKRPIEDVIPTDDYSKKAVKETVEKKVKLTRAQKDLQKVDKKGMKSLTSYFTRKST